jgi:hypothetical protein
MLYWSLRFARSILTLTSVTSLLLETPVPLLSHGLSSHLGLLGVGVPPLSGFLRVGEAAVHTALADTLLPVVAHATGAGGKSSSGGAVRAITGHVAWGGTRSEGTSRWLGYCTVQHRKARHASLP